VDPRAPFVRAVERARADRGDEAAHAHRDDGLVDLAAGVKVVSEMRDPGGEVGARVEQRDEGAGYRIATDGLDRIMESPLILGKLLPLDHGYSVRHDMVCLGLSSAHYIGRAPRLSGIMAARLSWAILRRETPDERQSSSDGYA